MLPDGLDLDLDMDLDLAMDLDAEVEIKSALDDYGYTGDIEQDTQAEVSAVKAGFIARAKTEEKRRQKATDSEFWCALCFQSRAQLDEFLRALKLPLDQKYIEGQKLAKKIGVTITPDTGGFGNIRQPDPKWAKLSMEV